MIVKKNLSEQIYDSLKSDILEQKIGFGEKLVNRGLQEKYGVSSTPVRDAINRLYLDGLLDDISNNGARVIAFDYAMATEVNEVMSLLNLEAVRISAEKTASNAVSGALENCIEMQTRHSNNKKYFEHDKRFHLIFFESCRNSHFMKLYNQYSALWELLIHFYYGDKESNRATAISEHKEIARAYRAGDIPLAQSYMEGHFKAAVRHLDKMLNKNAVESAF